MSYRFLPNQTFIVVLQRICQVCNLLWPVSLWQSSENKSQINWNGTKAIYRSHFFKRKFDRLQNILRETELNTVFELFILDVFRYIFSQLRFNGTSKFSNYVVDSEHQKTWRCKKRLLLSPYSRTKSKLKSVENTLIKCYNWLLQMSLITVGIGTMTQRQIKIYLKNITGLYITDSSDLFILFFDWKGCSPCVK